MPLDFIEVSGAFDEHNGRYYESSLVIDDCSSSARIYHKIHNSNSHDNYFIHLVKDEKKWFISAQSNIFKVKHLFWARWDSKSNEPPEFQWNPCDSQMRYNYEKFQTPQLCVRSVVVNRKRNFDSQKFFLSESFSDVHFHCLDGTVLHAHKLILAQASSYFATFFEGPWDQECPDEIWKTTNSADDMKFILSHIYDLPFQADKFKENSLVKLRLAHEYGLEELLTCMECYLMKKIDTSNVKDILLSTDLLNLKVLKDFCFMFIKQKGYSLVMNENFVQMMENKKLWSELRSYLADTKHDNIPNKRLRV